MSLSFRGFFDRLRFNLIYLADPPWDTGIPVPELVDFISNHNPGRALDLGCGTGTNMEAFLEAGWEVDGVDIAWLATVEAKRKIQPYGDAGKVHFGSVTDLDFLDGRYDLIYDIGCFHALTRIEREEYIKNLRSLLRLGGNYLLYAFLKTPRNDFGLDVEDLNNLEIILSLDQRLDSVDERGRNAVFLRYSNV